MASLKPQICPFKFENPVCRPAFVFSTDLKSPINSLLFVLVKWSLSCFPSAGPLAADIGERGVYASRRSVLAAKCSPREEGMQGLEGDLHNSDLIDQQAFLHSQFFKCILVEETM